jgi:hypothetical protein
MFISIGKARVALTLAITIHEVTDLYFDYAAGIPRRSRCMCIQEATKWRSVSEGISYQLKATKEEKNEGMVSTIVRIQENALFECPKISHGFLQLCRRRGIASRTLHLNT